MSVIEIEPLLAEISFQAPCGENLEYNPDYGDLERAAAGKEEQQFGDTVVPAEEPDWRDVRRRAADLLSRSKDLRIGVYLVQGLLRTDGVAGLCDGVRLLVGLVERYWDQVHPQLDPDDDNDPTIRVNTMLTLCHQEAVLGVLRETPLVSVRSLGRFSLRDLQIASGELAPLEDEAQKADAATIEAALAQADAAELRATHDALEETIGYLRRLEEEITEKVGSSQAPSFDDLVTLLRSMHKPLHEQLDRRGEFRQQEPQMESPTDGASGNENESQTIHEAPRTARLDGEIHSRDDVIRALEMVCKYYERHEPSSPIPLLLNRAKRLATMSFIEIIRELTPDGVSQAEAIAGLLRVSEDGE
jgi:type VI secretion system protein ImpA